MQANLALLFLKLIGIENLVDAIRDPVRIQNVRVLQSRVVPVVQYDAEVVQITRKRFLSALVRFPILITELAVLLKALVILLHPREFFLNCEPACRESVAQVFKTISLSLNGFTKLLASDSIFAISLNEFAYDRILLLQSAAVHVKGMLFDFVQYDNDRRFAAETLDELEPVFRICIFATFAPVENQ